MVSLNQEKFRKHSFLNGFSRNYRNFIFVVLHICNLGWMLWMQAFYHYMAEIVAILEKPREENIVIFSSGAS